MTTKEIIEYLKAKKRHLEAVVDDMGGRALPKRYEMVYFLGKIHMLSNLLEMFEKEEQMEGLK